MKHKLIISVLLPALTLPTFAQIDKGAYMVGGSGYLTIPQPNKQRHWTASLSPNIGYFIVDNLAVGLDISGSMARSKIDDSTSTHDDIVEGGPFVRYYIGLNDKLKLPVETRFRYVRYHYAWVSTSSTCYDSKDATYYAGLGTGLAYFLNDRVALEAMFYYNTNSLKDIRLKYLTGTFLFDIGLQIFLTCSTKSKE